MGEINHETFSEFEKEFLVRKEALDRALELSRLSGQTSLRGLWADVDRFERYLNGEPARLIFSNILQE